MDDDKRTLTLKINGADYPAAPLDQGQLVAIQLIKSVAPHTVLGILSSLIKASLGESAHAQVILAMAAGELDIKGLMNVLTDLAKATADAKEDSAGPQPKKPKAVAYPKISVTDGGE